MSVYEVKTIEDTIGKIDYVGRGIVAGLTPDGKKAVTAYFISGRSENSRNRVFVYRDDALFTEPFDPSKVVDPSLIIYAAVRKTGDKLIVTNGDQTDTIAKGIENGGDFIGALRTREFEPDAPNFTPRISCEFDFSDGYRYRISILKSADEAGGACNRFFYEYVPVAGVGHFISTYERGGNPLPTFTGEPKRIAIVPEPEKFADSVWNALDKENRISLFVRYTDLFTGEESDVIINKNK